MTPATQAKLTDLRAAYDAQYARVLRLTNTGEHVCMTEFQALGEAETALSDFERAHAIPTRTYEDA